MSAAVLPLRIDLVADLEASIQAEQVAKYLSVGQPQTVRAAVRKAILALYSCADRDCLVAVDGLERAVGVKR